MTLPLHYVCAGNAGGFDLYDDLIVSRNWLWPLHRLQYLRSAEAGDFNHGHFSKVAQSRRPSTR